MSSAETPAAGKRGKRTRHRARQETKRATFPFINGQIIAVADTGDIALTLSIIETYISDMNLVNMATALHRLAKLTANDTATRALLLEHSVLVQLVGDVNALLEKNRAAGGSPHCQVLSNISWALATLKIPDVPLLGAIAQLSCRLVAGFKPFELSATLWAFASFAEEEIITIDCFTSFFEASTNYIGCHMHLFSFRCLVMIVWALATVGQHSGDLFFNIATAMIKDVRSASTQEMARIVWSFSKVGTCPNQLFTIVAEKSTRSLGEFTSIDLFHMLLGFAVSSFWYDDIFLRAATAVQMRELHEGQVAKLFNAMSLARPRHPTTRAVLRLLLPHCQLPKFTPEDLSYAMLAVARCFGEHNAKRDLAEVNSRVGASPTWGQSEISIRSTPLQVSNFIQSCMHHVPSCVDSFSTQVMADIAWSFLAMKVEGSQNLLPLLGKEALVRRTELEVPALLSLLRCLLTVQNQAAGIAVRLFFAEAGRRVNKLGYDERQRLAYLCAEAELSQKKCTASSDELEMRCRNLSTSYVAMAAQQEVAELQEEQRVPSDQSGQQQQNRLLDTNEVGPHAVEHSCFNDAYQVFRSMEWTAAPTVGQSSITEGDSRVQQPEAPSQPMIRTGSKVLPPPLDFVPQHISLDNLQSYRMEYQRFRTGDASGAKGEVSNRVTQVTDPERGKVSKQLPPPLDFIPADISREKLQVYRMDYQEFRAGRATGAKGEVEKVVSRHEPRFIFLDNLLSVGQKYKTAQAPLGLRSVGTDILVHAPGRLAAIPGSTSSTSSQSLRAAEASPEHLIHDTGTCSAHVAPPTMGSEEGNAGSDGGKPTSWDGKTDVLSEMTDHPVKNTFLHFQEASPEDSEDDPDEKEHTARLPPPLDFLPSTVSADKLNSFRLDYQKFRSGKSSGAKGEVSESVDEG